MSEIKDNEASKEGPVRAEENIKDRQTLREEGLKQLAAQLAPCGPILEMDPDFIHKVLAIPEKYWWQFSKAQYTASKIEPTVEEIAQILDMAKVVHIMDEPGLMKRPIGVTGPMGPQGFPGSIGPLNLQGATGPVGSQKR